MSDFKFKKDDVITNDTAEYTVITPLVIAGNRFYVIHTSSRTMPDVVRQDWAENFYTLKPKYKVGEIYLSADGSKAFLMESRGWMSRLFQKPGFVCGDVRPHTGYDRPERYEGDYGPLIKWESTLDKEQLK